MSEDPPPGSTLDALILDLGGVLIKTPRVSSNKSIPSLKRFTSTLAWMRMSVVRSKRPDSTTSLGNNSASIHQSSMKQLLSHAPQSNTEQVMSWIQALRKDQPSLKIVAMSNISKPDFDALHTRWGPAFCPLFDEVFTSSASTRIDPRKTIFVDDNIQNIISAGSFGMQSVLFEDTFILARTVKTLLSDPIVRGKAFLRENAKQLHSFTECGIAVLENYVQLLILEATGDELPDDNDTTALGMQIVNYDDVIAHSLLDQMLKWMNEDSIIDMYQDRNRPRFDPIISVNLCTSFYLYQREHQVQDMINWVRNILYHRAYSKGTYYFRCPDWFLFYVNRLLVISKSPSLESIGPLLKERAQERIGIPGDSIALAMRLIICNSTGAYNYQDFEALKELRRDDGGWDAGYLYSFPIIGRKVMNRGLGTALAVKALSGRISKP
ncbi:HAD-superfamily hydrolase subfamily IA variant 3 [Penicillium cf. viridicatum]|uniref:HAD-superfamily hydrolase subfamily IA variant 3 n=1 Tax=Penicillium cf. viridicatum TaxID=2972119 RepID=A0A9W9N5G9_9EURO|nr:HAD-superfamily hydrolase subfamily IA variant 3 [Penicillium cf. viridicatum]